MQGEQSPGAQRKSGDGFHVLELTAVRQGATRTIRVSSHVDAPDDDLNRTWRRLTGEGWSVTIARWIA